MPTESALPKRMWRWGEYAVWESALVRIERHLDQKGPAKVTSARRGTLSQNGYGGIWAGPKHADRECTSQNCETRVRGNVALERICRLRECAVRENVLLERICRYRESSVRYNACNPQTTFPTWGLERRRHKKPAAPRGLPGRSPTPVLTGPCAA